MLLVSFGFDDGEVCCVPRLNSQGAPRGFLRDQAGFQEIRTPASSRRMERDANCVRTNVRARTPIYIARALDDTAGAPLFLGVFD